ncbi:bifunctional 3-phosphoshikimate 1-carboxyvinyltransferase/cytidylate kinase [Aquabacterium sp. A7-Y]|uniref:bifunctional 3-phosphoshikimate 1-carboxyvinyltransferase/cytidylate kinase n=1 Tax=Aquabacterium sp. A7-Y TaxID=1349605 RepID=UPI00223D9E24|nr:bifunctional 3-phosphoshikimate 1-carboxyvinyltransferase/cytidylate kinase [Aquabacterium sp. A7-Y]MCW7536494.1 bifunctional 3-phosphoshikimate 1-carboxyvinyltransferase/cytidylate kinase [Aquabacterium sp. A7-Y]
MYATEFLDLPPLQAAAGTVRLPGSKSISNRLLLLAGLSEGRTVLHDLLDSDDTRVMIAALRQLGCSIAPQDGGLCVIGLGGRLTVTQAQLFLGNAGTAMRPLCAALALLSGLQGGEFEVSGVARMHERPIGDLVDALRGVGCRIDYLGNEGYPPLRLAGGAPRLGPPIRVRGDVSSQFLTALLLALPLLSEQGPVVVEVQGELISKPYIEITLNLLQRFGIPIEREEWRRFTIPAGSRYRSPGHVHVEGDASSASYFVALGALAADAARPLRIEGVGSESIQGDIRFVEAAQAMGAIVQQGPNWLEVWRGAWPLKALDLDCNHIPDAAMTLAVMALYADGPTRLRNIASWRVKETDRIAAMATELRKLGAQVNEGPDFIEVHPIAANGWRPAAIHTYDDHRVAMCFSLAAFNRLAGAAPGAPVRILDPKCVAKTFPDYFETLFGVAKAELADIPVITIDGPTASGKGTLASEVAKALGYHLLDSGALYRATALAALDAGIPADDEASLARLAAGLQLRFDDQRIELAGRDVTDALRREEVGLLASRVSAHAAVREALRDLQLSFRRLPGLVADGRDMGTVIFPDAALKVFLTASAATRAERRHKQLISKGISTTIADLRQDLEARDARDRSRSAAPLKPAEDAVSLDNSALSIEESVQQVLAWWQQRRPV